MVKQQYSVRPGTDDTKPGFTISRALLLTGGSMCCLALIANILALTLPYWVSISETMETTVAGLTDATDIQYFYGLNKYCLRMAATHLNVDECQVKSLDAIQDWELMTFITLVVGAALLLVTVIQLALNLCIWDKLILLVGANVSSLTAGVCTSAGVSLYQMKATVQIVDIGGLATMNFRPEFLGIAFWAGVSSSAIALVASLLLILGVFTWKRPKQPRQVIGGTYKTTVKHQQCPHKGRQPAVITMSQVE